MEQSLRVKSHELMVVYFLHKGSWWTHVKDIQNSKLISLHHRARKYASFQVFDVSEIQPKSLYTSEVIKGGNNQNNLC